MIRFLAIILCAVFLFFSVLMAILGFDIKLVIIFYSIIGGLTLSLFCLEKRDANKDDSDADPKE